MGSAFHQLCPRYSGTLTPMAIRLWETFTYSERPKLYTIMAFLSAIGLSYFLVPFLVKDL